MMGTEIHPWRGKRGRRRGRVGRGHRERAGGQPRHESRDATSLCKASRQFDRFCRPFFRGMEWFARPNDG